MFFLKKYIALIFLVICFSVSSANVDERINVMECSHNEVLAYMKLPDPGRSALNNYLIVSKAIKQVSIKKEQKDPRSCASVLYGDLSNMSDNAKKALELFSLSAGVGWDLFKEKLLDLSVDKIMGSICGRIKVVSNSAQEVITREVKLARDEAIADLMREYGPSAAVDYLSDKYITDEYGVDLKFRNGGLDTDSFRSQVKTRWRDTLDELRDNVTGN